MSDIVAFAIAALAMAGLQAIPWVLLRRAEDRYCASLARWHAESVIREARYKAILRDWEGITTWDITPRGRLALQCDAAARAVLA